MTSLPLGILAMLLLVGYSLAEVEARVFLNAHAIGLVWGGTIAILFASTPWREIRALCKSVLALWATDIPVNAVNDTIVAMAKGARTAQNAKHPLLTRAVGLWEQGVDEELFETLLHQSLDEMNQSLEQAVAALRNLSKYPPALGMTGTVMGLVTMFSQLAPDKQANMGESLALAMTATFYGLILANTLILPLADRLSVMQISRTRFNDYVFRALILVHRGEASSVIEDKIHAFAA